VRENRNSIIGTSTPFGSTNERVCDNSFARIPVMNRRPLSVTIVSCLLIVTGLVGLAYHVTELKPQHPFQNDAVWVELLRVLAIVFGVFMLRGSNWARWLTLVWIGYHVVLSIFHPISQLVTHILLLAVFAYFLFRPAAREFFHPARAATA
jgi:hypothetical protein